MMPARKASVTAVALAILAAAGCTVGPDFVAPLPELLDSRTFLDTGRPARAPVPILRRTTAAAPEAEWWRVFRDPLLTQLASRIAAQNLDVQTATFKVAESRAQLGTAAAAAYPTINGTASAYREQFSRNGLITLAGGTSAVTGGGSSGSTASITSPFESYTAGFDASWELDLWGKVRRQVETSKAQLDSSVEARRDTLVSSLAELARDYIQLRGVQEQIRVVQATIRVNNDLLSLTRSRQVAGLQTGVDTASASSNLESARAQLPPLQQQEVSQINAISLLLGEPPLALSQELIGAKRVPPVPPRIPIGVPADLIRRRPDVREAEANLHAAVAQIGVAVAQFLPAVTITGSPTFNALDPAKVFRASSLQYMNVGPSVSIPIFEGGRLKSNLLLQQATQQEKAVAYQKAVLQAWHDVVNALTSLQTDQARRTRLSLQVGDAQRALDLSRVRYQQGVDTFTTVLQNSQTLLQARTNLAQATATVSTDLVALYKALGGGWETSFPADGMPAVVDAVAALPTDTDPTGRD